MATIDAKVRLQRADELFDASQYDAFDPYSLPMPALDLLHEFLLPKPITDDVRMVVYLPDEHVQPDKVNATREAIRRYTAHRITHANVELEQMRSEGARTAALAVVVALALIVLVVALEPVLSTGADQALSAIATIVMWVAIWRPTELLLFDQLPLRRSRRIWKRIQNLPLELRPWSEMPPDARLINAV